MTTSTRGGTDRPRGTPGALDPGESHQAPSSGALGEASRVDLRTEPSPDLATPARALVPVFPMVERGTGLVLSAGRPGELRIHWRLERDDFEQAAGSFPPTGRRPMAVLRLRRDRPEGGSDQTDEIPLGVEVRAGSGRRGVGVPVDHQLYRVELGLASADGGWLMLARSNGLYNAVGIGLDLGRFLGRSPGGPVAGGAPPLPADGQASNDLGPGVPDAVRERQAPDLAVPVEPALGGVHGVTLGPEFPLVPPGRGPRPPRSGPPDAAPSDTAAVSLPQGRAGDGAGAQRDAQVGGAFPFESSRQDAGGVQTLAPGTQGRGSGAIESESPRIGVPLVPLTYERPPERALGLELEAELRISGRAAPGSTVDLFGYLYRVGPGGRFQLSLPVTDPEILRLALRAAPPPEFAERRDD